VVELYVGQILEHLIAMIFISRLIMKFGD